MSREDDDEWDSFLGREARRDGVALDACPEPDGTRSARLWREGWQAEDRAILQAGWTKAQRFASYVSAVPMSRHQLAMMLDMWRAEPIGDGFYRMTDGSVWPVPAKLEDAAQ